MIGALIIGTLCFLIILLYFVVPYLITKRDKEYAAQQEAKYQEMLEKSKQKEREWELNNPCTIKLAEIILKTYTKEIIVSSAFYTSFLEEGNRNWSDKKYFLNALISGELVHYGNELVPEIIIKAKNWHPPIEILDSVDLSEEL